MNVRVAGPMDAHDNQTKLSGYHIHT
jgi:hypothetical protein